MTHDSPKWAKRSGGSSDSVWPPLVILWDDRLARHRLVARIVSECGARLLEPESLSSLRHLRSILHGGLALLALAAPPAPGDPALEVIAILKRQGLRVLAYEDGSQQWTVGTRCQALLAGAGCLLDSAAPEFEASLAQLVQRFLSSESRRAEEEQRLRDIMRSFGIVGESTPMMTLLRQVLRVSPLSDVPVLLTGETGTGKELAARAIHGLDGKRSRGPFVALNCAAVSAGLAESELFGHRRGAFTGAEQHRRGLVRAAQGGTLFLDEVGEMELSLQAKLLRVLQESRVLGVGEEQEVAVDVRVLAASNRDLEQLVREQRFRADLFHRLNVLCLRLPPLRERREDIPALIRHFLVKYESLGPCPGAGEDFVDAILQLELPGNVRELENLVRSALVNRPAGSSLQLSDLPLRVWHELTKSASGPSKPVRAAHEETNAAARGEALPGSVPLMQLLESHGWNLGECLGHCERVILESALRVARGNQAKAARMLGITPRSVYNKLQKHRLQHKKGA